MRIRLDPDLCQGHGTCVEEAPALFALDEKESKAIVKQPVPPEDLLAQARAAVRFCPTRALTLEDE